MATRLRRPRGPPTDDGFHRLDALIEQYVRSLRGFVRVETWNAAEVVLVNAIYYVSDRKSLAQLARFPRHCEAEGQIERWYEGYRIVISEVTAIDGDGQSDE